MSRSELERIFDPSSIAIVGASSDPAKRGHQILRALAESGYQGEVHAVNPRGGEVLGHEGLPSVDDLPSGVDLAVLCTPAATAPGIVRACGSRGVGAAVVLAVGFGESGPEGEAIEAELLQAARDSGVRVVGPNTSGLLNQWRGVNLVGARGVRRGELALLVQSGNVALSLMTEVTERSWNGVSVYLGVGNEVDIGFSDALDFLEHDERTKAVIVYVEGLRDARSFLSTAARVTRTKPIVAIKSGRTARGARAALSHTGAVAGPYERLSAALRQAGVVELDRTDELLHVAEALGYQPVCPPDKGICILSDGGGQGAIAVDALTEGGATLAALGDDTRAALRSLLGPSAAVANPVDLAGAADADPEVFARALDVVLADPAVGPVLVIGLFGGYAIRFSETLLDGEVRAAQRMLASSKARGTGLVLHSMYAGHRAEPLRVLGEGGVPVVASLDTACRCALELQRRGRALRRPVWSATLDGETTDPDSHSVILQARRDGRSVLTEPEARLLLADHGMVFGPWVVAGSEDEAEHAFEELEGPVAVKLVSATITHKSDADGVRLGVDSTESARAAFRSVTESAERYARQGGLDIEAPRALLTPLLSAPRAELLVGAYRDPSLGPVLTLGAGGVWVELTKDVAHRVLPVTERDVREALHELRLSRRLAAHRGHPEVEIESIVSATVAVSRTITANPEITEIEVNPLFVYEDRSVPVDARVVLADEA